MLKAFFLPLKERKAILNRPLKISAKLKFKCLLFPFGRSEAFGKVNKQGYN